MAVIMNSAPMIANHQRREGFAAHRWELSREILATQSETTGLPGTYRQAER